MGEVVIEPDVSTVEVHDEKTIVVLGTGIQGPPGPAGSTPLTTKGDMLVRGSSVDERLPVGVNGQIIVADASASLGVKWTTPGNAGGSFDGGRADTVYNDATGFDLGGSI